MDTATTGISERFDYVLDGGAGGQTGSPGDYLYYSTRTFAFESGAWGIFRVHDKLQSNLKVLPNRPTPSSGSGFPKLTAATGNTQADAGSQPAVGVQRQRVGQHGGRHVDGQPVPRRRPGSRTYDVSVFNKTLPTTPFADTSGVIYALTSDVAAIQAGTKPVEPLVLRANQGDCVRITLRNQTTPGSLYGGTRAGFDAGQAAAQPAARLRVGGRAQPRHDGAGSGQSITYKYYVDGTAARSFSRTWAASPPCATAPTGCSSSSRSSSTWSDSFTNAPLNSTRTATQAVIRAPNGFKFREFALTHGHDRPAVRAQHRAVHRAGRRHRDQQSSPRPTSPPHRFREHRRGRRTTLARFDKALQQHELPHRGR